MFFVIKLYSECFVLSKKSKVRFTTRFHLDCGEFHVKIIGKFNSLFVSIFPALIQLFLVTFTFTACVESEASQTQGFTNSSAQLSCRKNLRNVEKFFQQSMRATKQWLILRWRQLSFYSNKLNKIIYKSLFTPIQNELGLQPSSETYSHSTFKSFYFHLFSAVSSNVIPVFIVNCGCLRSTKPGKLKSFCFNSVENRSFGVKNQLAILVLLETTLRWMNCCDWGSSLETALPSVFFNEMSAKWCWGEPNLWAGVETVLIHGRDRFSSCQLTSIHRFLRNKCYFSFLALFYAFFL